MKGDFTRNTFNPHKHFTRVLMQQGRVQLDADLNEQAAILLHYLQTLASDLIGRHGGPNTTDLGFEITVVQDGNRITDLKIGVGRYYVDGILCEHEPKVDANGNKIATISYHGQAENYPLTRDKDKFPEQPFLVYLDIWERHITALEDDNIREVALGGPDTATRAQVIWQVKTLPLRNDDGTTLVNEKISCAVINSEWDQWHKKLQPENRGLLQARANKPTNGDSQDPCITSPDARYRGAENQLYRVEIHKSGSSWDGKKENLDNAATCKWSRNNGSVVAVWLSTNGNDLIVSGVRARARGLMSGQWVELTHDALELRGELGTFVRLVKVEGETLTIDSATTTDPIPNPSNLKNPKVRCWDQQASGNVTLHKGTVPIKEDTWQDLEDGIQIQFQKGKEPAQYSPGDYWLIPARTATGDVEWPQESGKPTAVPPHGIEHHYAPLAVISTGTKLEDCRCTFNQLCTVDTDLDI